MGGRTACHKSGMTVETRFDFTSQTTGGDGSDAIQTGAAKSRDGLAVVIAVSCLPQAQPRSWS